MDLNFQIKLLKISYLFQFLILTIIIIFYVSYKKDIIWTSLLLDIFFLILIIILILIAAYPLFFLVITYIKTTYNIFSYLLKLTILFTFISIITVMASIIIFYFINKSYPRFYRNCPFNYNIFDIENKFREFKNNKNKILELKELCENRRCIHQTDFYEKETNTFSHLYLCNYNPSYDFKHVSENENTIICENLISKNIFDSQYHIIYINLCKSLIDFFICKTTKEPKVYNIKSNYICPKRAKKSITLEVIISFLNMILSSLIYIVQFIYYKKILKIIVTRNVNRTINENREGSGRTIDTSKKTGLNPENNSFKKEQTQLIIVDNAQNNEEIFQIYNKDKKYTKRNVKNMKPELFHYLKKNQ